jgi:hypothetical protein
MVDNKLELVVEVDVNKANASIKSVNTGLSSMEQAASKAARGASAGIDGLTVSMVKGAAAGNLLAEGIKKAIEFAKEWTIDAAKHAAHTDKMSLSMSALAKAHGVSTEAANRAVEAVKKVGFGTQDAIHAVDRLMIADMNLAKAEGLAKVAKDAAAIENISAGEALEKLLMAIESGASRGLRTMGIFVDLNKEVERQELLTGKVLSENEVKQIRYNAVMREAAKIQGAATAASRSAEAQNAALTREITELKEAVGEQFQGYLKAWVGHLRELVGFLRDNADWIAKFGEAAIWLAGVLATYAIATKIAGITTAVQGLTVALAANPWGLLLAGVAAGGAVIYKTWKDTEEGLERSYEDMRRQSIQQNLTSGKMKLDDVRKMGYSDDQIREIISGRRQLAGDSFDLGFPKLNIRIGNGGPSDEDLRRMAEERKRRADAERQAQDTYMRAVEERKSAEHDMARARIEDSMRIIESTQSETEAARQSLNVLMLSRQEYEAGIEKIREEEKREIEQRSTYTDNKSGAVRHFKLSQPALEAIHKATAEKIAAFDLRFNEEESRRIEAMWKAMAARQRQMFERFVVEPMKQQLYVWEQTAQWQEKIDDQGRSARLAAVEQRKDLELAQLESFDAMTLQDKMRVEQLKTEIEVRAMKERARIQIEMLDAQTERDVAAARRAAMAQGIFYEPYLQEIESKVRELGQHEKDALQKATTSEIDVAQAKGAAATRKLVVDHYRSIFQSLKEQAGGVFDALVTKSQSVWSAIGNSLKTALLTAIKDVVTSRVAAMLMYLFTGQKVTFAGGGTASGGSGSVLGGLGGLLGVGAVPLFGGTGGGTFGSGPVNGNPMVLSATGGGGLTSKAGMLGNLKQSLTGWKDLLTNLGNIGFKPERWSMDEAGNLTKIANARGIGGLKGGAMLAGGSILAMDGLRRGGWMGVGETTAGGALIGAKFGGPIGAVIGGAIGFAAGIVRLFVKGAVEKAREKIKALYGIDISDKGVLQQIVDTAKSAYGGNLDMAIRTQQVRDLIQLYAMSTGQSTKGMPATVHSLDMVQTGGSLYQSPGYSNGSALSSLGGLPTLDSINSGTASGAGLGTTVVNLQIDSKTVGNVVIQNGRVVTQGAINAMKANAGRREMTSLQVSPGLITA